MPGVSLLPGRRLPQLPAESAARSASGHLQCKDSSPAALDRRTLQRHLLLRRTRGSWRPCLHCMHGSLTFINKARPAPGFNAAMGQPVLPATTPARRPAAGVPAAHAG
jgi:hypothetical protein